PADVIVGGGDGSVDLVVIVSARGRRTVWLSDSSADGSSCDRFSCNADYVAVSGTLNFAVGETTKVVRVDLFDCAIDDASKTFTRSEERRVGKDSRRRRWRVCIVRKNTVGDPSALWVHYADVCE